MGKNEPFPKPVERLAAGEVGFLICGIKDIRDVKVGDTVTDAKKPAAEALPGFQRITPMVFAGIFPVVATEYENLKDALDKLALNDSSLAFEPEKSTALGFGYRCGFLGLLHMEIVQERLEREFNLNLITTAPTVVYKVFKTDGTALDLENPSMLPDETQIEHMDEMINTGEGCNGADRDAMAGVRKFGIRPDRFVPVRRRSRRSADASR